MDTTCLFCQIANGELPVELLERAENYVVFRDIAPQAPEHLLVVPTRHVACLSAHDAPAELGELFAAAARWGRGVGPAGYRLVVNEGQDAGQTVAHLHLHLLAGRHLSWPPG